MNKSTLCRQAVENCANLEEGVDFNGRLRDAREGSLGTLAGTPQSSQSARVVRDIMRGPALELVLEVLQKVVVEVFTAQVSVSSGSLDGEDATSDVQERDIKSAATQIEDENVFLLFILLFVETVGNGSRGWLIDDSKDVQTSNSAGIFCGQAL
jgi:hypothetical protein